MFVKCMVIHYKQVYSCNMNVRRMRQQSVDMEIKLNKMQSMKLNLTKYTARIENEQNAHHKIKLKYTS